MGQGLAGRETQGLNNSLDMEGGQRVLHVCVFVHVHMSAFACMCLRTKIKRLNASRHKRISASVKVVHNEYSTDFVCPNEASAM